MGYFMYLMESTASFKKKNAKKILDVIKNLHGSETITDDSGQHFSWVDDSFSDIEDIEQMFKEWRWEIEDQGKDYLVTSFLGEKLGDEAVLFEAIAPYMNNGHIIVRGEDDYIWKWKFNKGKFREVSGRVAFDDEFHIEIENKK